MPPRSLATKGPMAFELERIRETDIILVRASGEGSVQEVYALLEALTTQTLVPTLAAVLLDLRELQNAPSPAEARVLAEAFGNFAVAHGCRLAYVAQPGYPFGIMRMVEMQAQVHGAVTATFSDYPEALRWLAGGVRPGGRRTTPGSGLSRPKA
ncbi:MAG: hypothetical protein IPK12_20055 [Gemmatimonadetes bacterium]|nr:hypothetical protein [Gemmatimonadota bacterium]